jgi:Uma2 family endonuclease
MILTKDTIKPEGKFRMSFAEFELLCEMQFFGDARVELLNGEVYVKGKQNPPHQQAVRYLSKLLEQTFGQEMLISAQLPIILESPLILESPPPDYVEPDIALLKLPLENYNDRDATNQDVQLLIEISDTTLARDQGEKLEAYARNQISEYWILNLNKARLEVYQQPIGLEYSLKKIYQVGQKISPQGFESLISWWLPRLETP